VNVRSARSLAGTTASEDQTARARIRDAAILRFGQEGFGAGLRTVAQDAGVSPALVVHHFGTKHGLRAECDAYVLGSIRELKEKSLASGGMDDVLLALASMDDAAPLLGYALRSLQAGGDLARDFVEHFVADAEEYIATAVAAGLMVASRDEKARARYLTVQSFGALLLDLTLHPPLDPTDLVGVLHGYMDRMGLPTVELYTQGLMTDTTMLDAYLVHTDDAATAGTTGRGHPGGDTATAPPPSPA
jgi:AcrR family transcriptional regulator